MQAYKRKLYSLLSGEKINIKKCFFILSFVLILLCVGGKNAYAAKAFGATSTTDGALESVKALTTTGGYVNTGDFAVVVTTTEFCTYRYDSTSTGTEAGSGCTAPYVQPSDNAGDGRWVLVDVAGRGAFIDTSSLAYYLSGNVGIGTNSPQFTLDIVKEDVTNDTILNILQIQRTTSNAANGAAGIGGAIRFMSEKDDGAMASSAQIKSTLVNAGASSARGTLELCARLSGNCNTVIKIENEQADIIGDMRIQGGNVILVDGQITSEGADGTHLWNYCNSIAYSGTKTEGDVYCNSTNNTLTVYFDMKTIYLVRREYTVTAPSGACTDGAIDIIETDTSLLWICINGAWVSK